MSGMAVPEWANEDLRNAVSSGFEEVGAVQGFKVRDLKLVDNYSTFFAEVTMRGNDTILHFFPRAGAEDKWWYGHYIPKCRSCGKDRTGVQNAKNIPCDECGHVGLVYRPGRAETKPENLTFPENMLDLVSDAVSSAWMGDIAVENVDELEAIAVQIQGCALDEEQLMADVLVKVFDKVDEELDVG